jgi:hypothetical protein
MADADEMFGRGLDLLSLCRDAGVDVRGRQCLEIGTGWCPWVPLLLVVGGAKSVVTIDVNPWLSIRTALRTTNALLERSAQVAAALHVEEAAVGKTLARARQATTLADWLAALNIAYACKDLCSAALPAQSVDIILSSNVLEHVPPAELRAIHQESRRLLREFGAIVHRFNPQDHFSTVDRSITGANFLRFSEEEWTWLGGSGLSYHNRLRCPQHRAIIADSGFDIVLERTRADDRARQAIEAGELPVHPDFRSFNPVELSDDYMWVVARRAGSG